VVSSRFEMRRINHEDAHSLDGACTNWTESYFGRLRRAEAGASPQSLTASFSPNIRLPGSFDA